LLRWKLSTIGDNSSITALVRGVKPIGVVESSCVKAELTLPPYWWKS